MIKQRVNFSQDTFVFEMNQILRYLKPFSQELAASLETKHSKSEMLQTSSQFSEALHLFHSISEPQGVYSIAEVTSTSQGLIDSNDQLIFAYPLPLFEGATQCAFFSITLSSEIDKWRTELFNSREYSMAYLLEALSMSALSIMEKKLRDLIQVQMDDSLTLGPTLWPGSQGLPTEAVKEVLNLSGAKQIGISLESDLNLNPAKSLVGMVGIGSNLQRHHQSNECSFCQSRGACSYRMNIVDFDLRI